MKFKLYIELACRVQDFGLLDLLRFPADQLIENKGTWSARWWGNGKTKRMRSESRENVLKKLAMERCNEFELKWREAASEMRNAQLAGVELRFDPSPTSQLWAAVPKHPLKSHSDELNRLSFQGAESVQAGGYRLAYPSVLESWLEVASDEGFDDNQLQEASIQIIRAAIPENLAAVEIFGYGCLHGSCRRMLMTHSMGGVASWMDQLGEKFENLYPILIGPRVSCQGLASAAGNRCSLIPISATAPSAILNIDPSAIKTLSENPEVRRWLIERDISRPRLSLV